MDNLIPVTDILTEADFFNIDTESTQKAYRLATTQKQFELLYNKYYLELMQEATRPKAMQGDEKNDQYDI